MARNEDRVAVFLDPVSRAIVDDFKAMMLKDFCNELSDSKAILSLVKGAGSTGFRTK